MNELKKGFEFAIKHSLSPKEMGALIAFGEKPQSSTNLANDKKSTLSAMHAIITRLKLKGLIIEDCQDGQHKVYKINF
jgi:DNA-binding MarR family transcriptional regulator